jgi:hypothetical protein
VDQEETFTRTLWLVNERQSPPSPRASAKDEPIDEEDQEGTDDRGDETRTFVRLIPADRPADESCEERSGDAEQDRYDATARVLARHEKLRDRSGKTADYDPSKDAIGFHMLPFPIRLSLRALHECLR